MIFAHVFNLQVAGPQLSCNIKARTCVPPGIHHSVWVIWVDHVILVDSHGFSGHVGKVCLLLQLRSECGDLSLWDQDLVRIHWIHICTSSISVGLRCVESKQRDFISPGQKLGVWWWIHTREESLFNSA